ncbi:exonuclease domain-containing protein [Shewanella sp. Isolate7]|uniref:exonuclease domain-containing protein n=1 Tax=Shewanella sp. Isolate7 TaxID=2908528 RepID=UPI001EFDE49C|nr:exonuclease domain-containing protein [Shewanella sp. Isolate7]MCG9723306.1 3'-5' exonuclease [Shewanella sp. Isolate7]
MVKDAMLKGYLQSLMPVIDESFMEAELLAIDLEMTGLDANFDQILSIGVVPIRRGQLILSEAQHKLVQIEGSVGQSATIHGILDAHLDAALTPEQAMAWFLTVSQGKVLVAHHAPLDLAFLQSGLQASLGEKTRLLAIDTLQLEKRRLLRQHEHLQEGSLRLGRSRARYGLPVYAAHNALIDALACGELLLAQVAAMGGANKVKIAELLA